MAGRRGNRWDSDVADADRNPIADFGPFHEHWARHLMSPAQTGGDHLTPAAKRGISDDGAAIFHWPQHCHIRIKEAVGEF